MRAEGEDAKARLTEAAFVGWQMGAGGAVRFGEYLRRLGLMETQPSSRIDAQAAMDNAARIVAMDKQRHG